MGCVQFNLNQMKTHILTEVHCAPQPAHCHTGSPLTTSAQCNTDMSTRNVNTGCTVSVCGKPQLQTSQRNMKTPTVCVLFCNTLEETTDFMLAPLPQSPSTQDTAPLSI